MYGLKKLKITGTLPLNRMLKSEFIFNYLLKDSLTI